MGLLDKLASKVGGNASGRPNSQQYPGGGGAYAPQPAYHQPNSYGSGYAQPAPQPVQSPQPPASGSSEKPSDDDRPLPEGWVKQWDNNYNRYFYVDTRATPPRSIWVHPNDETTNGANAPSGGYAPPSGPPSDNRGWAQPQPPYPQQQQQQQQPPYGQPQYAGYPQQPYGGYAQQPMYQQPPMMAQQQQQQQRMGGGRFGGGGGGGMGMAGGAALGLGAGMLGGALLANGLNNAYEDGYQDAQQDDYDGDDFGGDF